MARLLQRPRLARERPHLQSRRSRLLRGRRRSPERLDRLLVAVGRGERLGPLELRLDLRPLLGGHTRREEHRIDAELLGQPGDRRLGRPRLAALDLADVLLREPLARELGLCQTCGHAQRADALAQASARVERRRRGGLVHASISQVGSVSPCSPPAGGCAATASESTKGSPNHLTWLLDFSGHGSYSQAHTADDRTPDRMRGHHRRIGRRARDERGWAAEPRFTGSPPREGVASNGKRPRSRSRGRFRLAGGNDVSPAGPPSSARRSISRSWPTAE